MEPLSAVGGSENWFNPFGKLMWRFYKNTKIQLSYDLTDPLLDIHTKEMRTRHWIDIYTPMYTAALFTIAKIWKQSNFLPRDERLKMWYIYNEILFGHEKKGWKKSCHYRWATARAGRQGANSALEMASSTKLQAGSQFLTKSSWDPGWLTSARRVTARDQLPRGNKWHTWDGAPTAPRTREVIRRIAHLGRVCLPTTWSPECLDLGRAQNAGPTESVPLYPRTWVPENLNLSGLDLGSTHNPGPALQFPCRATWSLSSVDRESTHAVSGGKPSVAQTLRALPTHASDICLQCSSLPAAKLNQWT